MIIKRGATVYVRSSLIVHNFNRRLDRVFLLGANENFSHFLTCCNFPLQYSPYMIADYIHGVQTVAVPSVIRVR